LKIIQSLFYWECLAEIKFHKNRKILLPTLQLISQKKIRDREKKFSSVANFDGKQ